MRDEAKANEDADKAVKEKVDKLNAADQMIFQTEKQMAEFGDKLPADKKQPIEDAIAKVLSLSGNTFEWNDKSDKEGLDIGVIAQEVAGLDLPGLYTTREDGYMAVRYEKLVPLLIEAIKQLNAKVDEHHK